MALSPRVLEVLADRGELKKARLEAQVENCGTLEATWMGDLVGSLEHRKGKGLLGSRLQTLCGKPPLLLNEKKKSHQV